MVTRNRDVHEKNRLLKQPLMPRQLCDNRLGRAAAGRSNALCSKQLGSSNLPSSTCHHKLLSKGGFIATWAQLSPWWPSTWVPPHKRLPPLEPLIHGPESLPISF